MYFWKKLFGASLEIVFNNVNKFFSKMRAKIIFYFLKKLKVFSINFSGSLQVNFNWVLNLGSNLFFGEYSDFCLKTLKSL